jgi:cytochrome c
MARKTASAPLHPLKMLSIQTNGFMEKGLALPAAGCICIFLRVDGLAVARLRFISYAGSPEGDAPIQDKCPERRSARGDDMTFKNSLAAAAAFALIGFTGQAMAQDVEAGEKSYAKCRACHQVGETAKNGVGPVLNGMIGNFSEANKNSGLVWDEATFADYIKNPRAKIPGTKMVFAGITNETEIANLTAFLKQFGPDGKKK